jgi:hypothetical protein
MNASFVLQGVLIFARAIVVWPLFPRGALSRLALSLIAPSGLGVAIVGLAPEDAMHGWHYSGPRKTSCSAMRARLCLAWRCRGRGGRCELSGFSRWLLA